MKPEAEIIAAHDRIVGLMVDHEALFLKLSEKEQDAIINSASVLCWMLDHDHNTHFASNLAKLNTWMESKGLFFDADKKLKG